MSLSIDLVEKPDKAVIDAILAPLIDYSREKGFAFIPEDLTLVLRDEGGVIRGGLVAETAWAWMYVKLLAVHETLRRENLGRRLMERAEEIAKARGCVGAWVDTYSFQSPDFYRKIGYEEWGRLPDYPPGHSRIFLRKAL
jgi:GNAT superfamily N-acetyltransferase